MNDTTHTEAEAQNSFGFAPYDIGTPFPHNYPRPREDGSAAYIAKGNAPILINSAQAETMGVDADARYVGIRSRKAMTPAMRRVTEALDNFIARVNLKPHSLRDGESIPGSNFIFIESPPGLGKTEGPQVVAEALGWKTLYLESAAARQNFDDAIITTTVAHNKNVPVYQRLNVALLQEPFNQFLYNMLVAEGVPLTDESNGVPQIDARKLNKGWQRTHLTLDAAELDDNTITKLEEEGVVFRNLSNDQLLLDLTDSDYTTDSNIDTLLTKVLDNKGWQDRIEIVNSGQIGVGGSNQRENFATLERIEKDAGLDPNNLQYETINGPLMKEFLAIEAEYARYGVAQPRMIVIDEMNRYRNLGKLMQNMWELLGGKNGRPVTLQDASGKPHTFTSDMLRNTFFCANGNNADRETEAYPFAESMRDRLGDSYIAIDDGQIGAADWQHMLERKLLGIGANLHNLAGQEKNGGNVWNNAPDGLVGHLLEHQTLGMTEAEKAAVTDWQKALLENYGNGVAQGITQVADALNALSALTQHNGERVEIALSAKQGEKIEVGGAAAEDFHKQGLTPPYVGFRVVETLMKKLINPEVVTATMAQLDADTDLSPLLRDPKHMGTLLVEAIRKEVNNVFPSNSFPAARTEAYRILAKTGVISREEAQRENVPSEDLPDSLNFKTVEKLLNVDPDGPYVQRQRLKMILADEVLPARHEGIRFDMTGERISEEITAIEEREMEVLEEEANPGHARLAHLPITASEILVPRLDVVENKTGKGQTSMSQQLTLGQDLEINASTRVEQETKENKPFFDALRAQQGQPGTLATTQEVLLGFLLLKNTKAEMDRVFDRKVGAVFEADVAEHVARGHEEALSHVNRLEKDKRLNLEGLVEYAERRLGTCLHALLPGTERKPDPTVWMEPAIALAENRHPSGLGVTVLHTMGYASEEANDFAQRSWADRHFDDALTVISYTPPEVTEETPEEVLVVGFSPISDVFIEQLAKKHITYVYAKDPKAVEKISPKLAQLDQKGLKRLSEAMKDARDAREEQGKGLLFQLETALNLFTPDAYDARRENPRAGDQGGDDLTRRRIRMIAEHMCDEQCVGAHAHPDHVIDSEGAVESGTLHLRMHQEQQPVTAAIQ